MGPRAYEGSAFRSDPRGGARIMPALNKLGCTVAIWSCLSTAYKPCTPVRAAPCPERRQPVPLCGFSQLFFGCKGAPLTAQLSDVAYVCCSLERSRLSGDSPVTSVVSSLTTSPVASQFSSSRTGGFRAIAAQTALCTCGSISARS